MKNRQRLTLLLLIAGSLLVLAGCAHKNNNESATAAWHPIKTFRHAHGLAVDSVDGTKLYIATHEGLYVLQNDRDLFRIGKSKDDYMGFSVHPNDPNIFFSSGHPARGGNIGVQKSVDGGATWEKISSGVFGPVDFHAMALSAADPNLLHGWYANALQRSLDGGVTWNIVPTNLKNVLTLAADPADSQKIFAATLTQDGLVVSHDQGMTWKRVSDQLQNNVAIALAINPKNSQQLFLFTQQQGLLESNDGGVTWQQHPERFGNDLVLFLAIDPQQPQTMYALTKQNALYKSQDQGNTWTKIRS